MKVQKMCSIKNEISYTGEQKIVLLERKFVSNKTLGIAKLERLNKMFQFGMSN